MLNKLSLGIPLVHFLHSFFILEAQLRSITVRNPAPKRKAELLLHSSGPLGFNCPPAARGDGTLQEWGNNLESGIRIEQMRGEEEELRLSQGTCCMARGREAGRLHSWLQLQNASSGSALQAPTWVHTQTPLAMAWHPQLLPAGPQPGSSSTHS